MSKPYIPALRRAESYTNSNSSSPKTSPRILAAPFQLKEEQDSGSKTPPKISGIETGQYSFVPLEDYSNVTFEKVQLLLLIYLLLLFLLCLYYMRMIITIYI
jgi:hypothetical protein